MPKLTARKSAFAGFVVMGLVASLAFALAPAAASAQDRIDGHYGRVSGFYGDRDDRSRGGRGEHFFRGDAYDREGVDRYRSGRDDHVGGEIGFYGDPAIDYGEPDDLYNPYEDCDYIVDDCY